MFRLLGLLGGLSVVTDLGTGAPLDESLRRCVVGVRLARVSGARDADVATVLWTSLLQHLGCTAYSHENAALWGDDVAAVRLAFLTDFSRPADVWRTWVPGIAEAGGTTRARALLTTVRDGRTADAEGPPATCEVARDACRRLGLPAEVQAALLHGLTTWDGKGYPRAAGDEIPWAARVMQVASTAVLFTLHAGRSAALAQLRLRRGRQLDPVLAGLLVDRPDLLDDVEEMDAFRLALEAEPDPVRRVGPDALQEVARTLGDLVDLKSPWLQGHSAAVAGLAADAACCLGLTPDGVGALRVAGHLHDVGRVGISSRIWDKPGPLTDSERDQVRLHAWHGERILHRVPELAEVATLVGQHHERCDGSGYHRGLTAAQLSLPSRVLAAADAYRDLVEERPHRPALGAAQAAKRLRTAAAAGRLDPDAVAAVLAAAGQGARSRPVHPAGLTERQVEVLRLVARGLSNPDIAARLGIARRTAEHHVQDVYGRIGVSTRAGAALFAMQHGLLDPADRGSERG